MATRNASVLGAGDQPTRCSYALVGGGTNNTGDRRRNGGGGGEIVVHYRNRRQSFDALGQPLGGRGRQSLLTSGRRTSGSPGVAEFQYKFANGRIDNR